MRQCDDSRCKRIQSCQDGQATVLHTLAGMLTLADAIMRPAGGIAHGPYLGAEAYLRIACGTAIVV